MFNISVNASILTTGEFDELESARNIDDLISPAQAVTIASWWQSPNGVGKVLASFASGCEVDNEELLNDIERTLELIYGYESDMEKRFVELLKKFVESFDLN